MNLLLQNRLIRELDKVMRDNDLIVDSEEGKAMLENLLNIGTILDVLLQDPRIPKTNGPLYRYCLVRALSRAVCDI